MIYLYVKTHNTTGLKYFGKTTQVDPHNYRGSGKYWKRHISKHGYDVTTDVIGVFETESECSIFAIEFSKKHNVVESDEWANLQEENGIDGAPKGRSVHEHTKQKISESLKGRTSLKSKYTMRESHEKRSERSRENIVGRVWANNRETSKRVLPPLLDGWVEGRLGDIGNKKLGHINKDGNNTKGKKIFNNGICHAYFFEDSAPEGWLPGKMAGYQGGTGTMKRGKVYGK